MLLQLSNRAQEPGRRRIGLPQALLRLRKALRATIQDNLQILSTPQRLPLYLLDLRGQRQPHRTQTLVLVLLRRFNLIAGTFTSVSRLAVIMTTDSERLEAINSIVMETSSPSYVFNIWQHAAGGETRAHGGDTIIASFTVYVVASTRHAITLCS